MKQLKVHKKAIQLILRFHHLDQSLVPLMLLHSLIKGVLPLLPIFFTGSILNNLIGGDINNAIISIGWLIGLEVVLQIGESIVRNQFIVHSKAVGREVERILYTYPLGLDYESMEDSSVMEEFTTALMSFRYRSNYSKLVQDYGVLLSNIVSFVILIILIIQLCLQAPKVSSGILSILATPVVFICLLLGSFSIFLVALQVVLSYSNREFEKNFTLQVESEEQLMSCLKMCLDNDLIKNNHIFHSYSIIRKLFDHTFKKTCANYKKIISLEMIGTNARELGNGFISIVAYILVGIKVLAKAITVGEFIQYIQGIIQLNIMLSLILSKQNEISECVVYFDKILNFLNRKNKFETGTIPIEKRDDYKYELAFEHVSFKYPNSNEYILKDVTFKLNLHNKSALVGANGSGKTTLIKLLCRLYEPTEGVITLNGVDIKKYNYTEYLSLFSVVFQDFVMLDLPIEENIACKKEFDKEKVKKCLHRAGLSNIEHRFDEVEEEKEGSKFSGGQKQKMAIARALYKDAPIVILDEPTAALDPMSEFDIYERLNDLIGEKTCLYISHRMSSCRFCDDIIVLDKGEIVERGNHNKLLSNNSYYKKMWEAQAKYYA